MAAEGLGLQVPLVGPALGMCRGGGGGGGAPSSLYGPAALTQWPATI